jgi:signal transduction histidine kinase
MKLQTKFNLGIILIFAVLAVGIAYMSFRFVNTNTIREAEDRVRIYARAAWEIHNATISRIRSAAEILAQEQIVRDVLEDSGAVPPSDEVRDYMETIRREQEMDILNLLTPDGRVVLRTRAPYNHGDSLIDDPMIRQVMSTHQSSSGNIILALERMDVEGTGLIERCMSVGGEPRGMLTGAAVPVLDGGQLIGIIQMGRLLNGAVDEVDRIRDAVFKDEYYAGKPVGTATVFLEDLRISTNVMDKEGRRAVGTRVSKEVADQILNEGRSWTGRAFVVDTWYLSQYDPIRDPEGNIIGMVYVGELEQKYLDIRTQAVVLYLSVIFAGMLLAFVLSYAVIRSVLGPIRNLSQATQQLAGGDLTHRVEVRGRDEVSDLSASFNEMAEQLQAQRQEIERRQRELEELSEELRVTNANYMEMLGFVAHELKNPLTSAMMSLYTVKDGYLGEVSDAQRKSLESVATSLDYFHDMIKNYLDLSRLEKGELEVRRSQVSLNDGVVAPVLEGLDRAIEDRGMLVENHIPGDLLIQADGNLLRIVYDNLLSNAIKYGQENGRIVLDAQQGGDGVTLSVLNDSEAGIPQDKLPLMFEKFRRLDSPEYAGKKGTGLGLYICKEIVEKHGGSIRADSRVGEWVKFSLTLPDGADTQQTAGDTPA